MKALLKSILLIVTLLIAAPLVWICRIIRKKTWAELLFRITSRILLYIVGVRLTVRGSLTAERPLLLVTNHLSYLDVPILASQHALRFTPKAEISSWPFFGWVCRLTGCIFVTRKAGKLVDNSSQIYAALEAGDAVCLFPEGTTGNGVHVLPFKSSFFSLAEREINGRQLVIQPAAIVYKRIRGLPIDITQWPDVAWYGDMDMVPHLWKLLSITPMTAEIIFLPPVTLQQFEDRKKLAQHCQQLIAETLIEAKN